MDVSTTDDFTRGVDALVYEINEAESLMPLTYPVDLFDRNITDGPAMLNMPKIHDFWVPPDYLRAFDGPSTTISDLWRVLGRPHKDGGFIVDTIIKPKLDLRPQPFADACYNFWLGGDFI